MAGYWIFKNCKNSKFHLTVSLPDHLYKPRCQMKYRTATIVQHNNKLTSEMGSDKCGASASCCSFYFPLASTLSSCSKTISMYYFFQSTLSSSTIIYVDATTSILKHLCHYSRRIGEVQIRYFKCKIQAKSVLKWVWQDRKNIYMAWWMAVICPSVFSLIRWTQ